MEYPVAVDLLNAPLQAKGILAVPQTAFNVSGVGFQDTNAQKLLQSLWTEELESLPPAVVPGQKDKVGQIAHMIEMKVRDEHLVDILHRVAEPEEIVNGVASAVHEKAFPADLNDLGGSTPLRVDPHRAASDQTEFHGAHDIGSFNPFIQGVLQGRYALMTSTKAGSFSAASGFERTRMNTTKCPRV